MLLFAFHQSSIKYYQPIIPFQTNITIIVINMLIIITTIKYYSHYSNKEKYIIAWIQILFGKEGNIKR